MKMSLTHVRACIKKQFWVLLFGVMVLGCWASFSTGKIYAQSPATYSLDNSSEDAASAKKINTSQTPVHHTLIERFYFMGDGKLSLQGQSIVYRDANNNYLESGLRKIHQLFRAPFDQPRERIALRFIEVMDYVQDGMRGGTYTLRSGYRSRRLNQGLRQKGKLAAQSSMHIEGAAADLILQGVASQKVYEYVKALDCCGIGWYGSRHFHLDTGPARFWTATTSKTEDKTPQRNAKVILQSDYDRYLPGEKVE